MIVTVIDRKAQFAACGHGASRPAVFLRTVAIGDTCPVCCGRRGPAATCTFTEDGETFAVDGWDNPCGHVDHYDAVLREARARLLHPLAER